LGELCSLYATGKLNPGRVDLHRPVKIRRRRAVHQLPRQRVDEVNEGQILREAPRLSGIPGALIHGRLDMSASLDTAWELAQAWPDAELTVIDTAGHQGNDAMRDAIRAAVDRLSPP